MVAIVVVLAGLTLVFVTGLGADEQPRGGVDLEIQDDDLNLLITDTGNLDEVIVRKNGWDAKHITDPGPGSYEVYTNVEEVDEFAIIGVTGEERAVIRTQFSLNDFPANEKWRSEAAGPPRANVQADEYPNNLKVAWTKTISETPTSLLFLPEDVYVTTEAGSLYELRSDERAGSVGYKKNVGTAVRGSPRYNNPFFVFLGADMTLYQLEKWGGINHTVSLAPGSSAAQEVSPVLDWNTDLYYIPVDSTGTNFHAYNASNQSVEWSLSVPGDGFTVSPTHYDKDIIVASSDGVVSRVDPASKSVNFSESIGATPTGSAITAGNDIYVPADDGNVYVVDDSGSGVVQTISIDTSSTVTTMAKSGKYLIAGTESGRVVRYDMWADTVHWQTTTNGSVTGIVLDGANTPYILASNATASTLTVHDTEDGSVLDTNEFASPASAPPILADRSVFIALESGEIFELDEDRSG